MVGDEEPEVGRLDEEKLEARCQEHWRGAGYRAGGLVRTATGRARPLCKAEAGLVLRDAWTYAKLRPTQCSDLRSAWTSAMLGEALCFMPRLRCVACGDELLLVHASSLVMPNSSIKLLVGACGAVVAAALLESPLDDRPRRTAACTRRCRGL